ncbi:UDP-glucoronosyl and UDP-glucosyl transferase [Popillia japonica]
MEELAGRGHEVHVVTHFPQKHPPPNYYDIDIGGSLPKSVGQLSIKSPYDRGFLGKIKYVFRTCGAEICEYLFRNLAIIDLKNSTMNFDLVISEVYGTDCLLGFAHKFQAPIIGISAVDLLPWAAERMGNPDNPSYIPNYFAATNEKMGIYEKFFGLATLFLSKIGYFFLSIAPSENKIKEFFGNQTAALETIVSNTSLILVNSHLSLNIPRPMVPNIVEIGGLHIDPPKILSQDLDKLVRTSQDGVIYFSLGTVVDLTSFEAPLLQTIMNVLGRLPQTIIWSGNISNNVTVPKNIHIHSWLDQLALLCDPNTKAFITLGGLMSLQEAAYCAVPILGIPIFPNHKRNIDKYVKSGAGLLLEYDDVNEATLKEALDDLIANLDYKRNAVKLSLIFKERPMGALDTAVYWAEYVVKFGGAQHLRCGAADLGWFEYYFVDCLIIMMGILGLGLLLGGLAIYFLQDSDVWNYIFKRGPQKREEGPEPETDKDK